MKDPATASPLDSAPGRWAADRIGLGIASALAGVFLFSIMDAAVKWLGQTYTPIQVVFLRYLFAMVPVAVFVWRSGGMAALRTRRPLGHALRAGLMFTALLTFVAGLSHLPLAEAIAVAFTAPLFVALLSGPVLGEKVGPRRWGAVGVGFLGALIMVRPGTSAFQPEALFVLASALGLACAQLMTRRMARTETNAAILTYSNLGAGLMCLPFLALVWQAPTGHDFGLFLFTGIVGGVASFLMIVAYRHAPAAVVAPFDYTALIWGAILGWVIWREQPDAPVWIGAAIVALAGLYITRREALAARRG
jgi:drug/metabolite transporter (DMT)-like permease